MGAPKRSTHPGSLRAASPTGLESARRCGSPGGEGRVKKVLRATGAAGLLSLAAGHDAAAQTSGVASYEKDADRIVAAATADRGAWSRLAELTDTFGPRLSGSAAPRGCPALGGSPHEGGRPRERAPRAGQGAVLGARDGRAWRSWSPRARRGPLVVLGLGNSVGTPAEGIEAEVVIVKSFDDLEAKGEAVRGRIVLFNVPYTGYGETVRYRGRRRLAGGEAGRAGDAAALRGPHRPADAAHGRPALRRGAAEDPRRRHSRGRRGAAAAPGRPRPAPARAPRDGGPLPARCRLRQRGGRDPGPREAGTRSSSWAATSIRGTSGSGRWTTAAAAS